MDPERKQALVDQRATNGQTIQFVADRATEIASTADALAKKDPGWSGVAATAREHRKTLMEIAAEEQRLATAIQMEEQPCREIAAAERERRKDLLEIAREEGRLAEQVQSAGSDDDSAGAIAEQAERNRDLLRHVARTATEADQALRQSDR